VNFSFVAMRSNIAELPALVDLSARLGTTGVHVEPLYSQEQDALEAHYRLENLGTLPPDQVMAIMNEAALRAAKQGVSVASRFLSEACGSFDYVERAPGLGIHWTCTEPWSSIWVTAAGEVRTCCINETSFGSLNENTFAEIWNGDAFRSFRADHASRARMPEGCGNCIRNGRPRQSPFFKTIETVTYRPLELPRSETSPPARIDWPPEGETITDPLVVVGTVENGERPRWEVVIDGCPLSAIEAVEGGRFVASGEVPFLTEGAHILWIRDPDDPASGWDHREVHFWRPEVAEPGVVRAASVAAVALGRPCCDARLFVDGRIQPHVLVAEALDRASILVMDARDIPAGVHGVEVWSGRAKVGAMRIERLSTEPRRRRTWSGESSQGEVVRGKGRKVRHLSMGEQDEGPLPLPTSP
ncbi:MAG TPA: SPASM domain-containing protein, partial [Thermoanaerobaculia bacterium]|nr:SPASM domain-containing protein [Thermoanaerobaculia bacterium]